jgi:hypothetical protein
MLTDYYNDSTHIKSAALWKGVEQMKFQWIPNNCHHRFGILNCMSWLFRGCSSGRSHMFMFRSEAKLGLVEGENELPFLMCDRQELV